MQSSANPPPTAMSQRPSVMLMVRRHSAVATFVAGFLFDFVTMQRIDAWTDLAFESPNPDYGMPISQLTAGPAFQAPFMLRIGARFEF